MIIPDVNLLVYVVNKNSAEHSQAFKWWKKVLNEENPIALLSTVGFGAVRILTNPRIFNTPLTIEEAFSYLEHWLSFPQVSWIDSHSDHFQKTKQLLLLSGGTGKLLTDAQIAAMTLLYRGTLYTNDADFSRFPGLSWKNPLNFKLNS